MFDIERIMDLVKILTDSYTSKQLSKEIILNALEEFIRENQIPQNVEDLIREYLRLNFAQADIKQPVTLIVKQKFIKEISTLIPELKFRRKREDQLKTIQPFRKVLTTLEKTKDDYKLNNRILKYVLNFIHVQTQYSSFHRYGLPMLLKECMIFLNKTFTDRSYQYNRWLVAKIYYYHNPNKCVAYIVAADLQLKREDVDIFLIESGLINGFGTEYNLTPYKKDFRPLDNRGRGINETRDYSLAKNLIRWARVIPKFETTRSSNMWDMNEDAMINKIFKKLHATRILKKENRLFYSIINPKYKLKETRSSRAGIRTSFYQTIQEVSEIVKSYSKTLNEVLQQCDTSSAFAYLKNKSILTCALEHKNARFILHCDIKSYFESLTAEKIAQILKLYLAEEEAWEIAIFCTYGGRLRLGTSLSPLISNIVGVQIDQEIRKLIPDGKGLEPIHYTRYSDDLIFSSTDKAMFDVEGFSNRIENMLSAKFDLHLNLAKTRFLTRRNPMRILSINVNEDVPSVSKKYRMKLRALIHNSIKELKADLFKYGDKLGDYHSREDVIHKYTSRIKMLQGKIAYIHSINPTQAKPLYIQLNHFKVALEEF